MKTPLETRAPSTRAFWKQFGLWNRNAWEYGLSAVESPGAACLKGHLLQGEECSRQEVMEGQWLIDRETWGTSNGFKGTVTIDLTSKRVED